MVTKWVNLIGSVENVSTRKLGSGMYCIFLNDEMIGSLAAVGYGGNLSLGIYLYCE